MTALLDSSAWLEYFFGSAAGEKVSPVVEGEDTIVLSKINVFEVYSKILKAAGREEAEKFVSFMLKRGFLDELSVDTLKLAGEEKRKFGLGMADAIIVATAVKHDAALYTRDQDFKSVAGLLEVIFV
ncbi:MAG: type II toxin-antitoxin system VapC family toxin [Candidatus Micrarchaeota archaeon]